MESRTRVPVMPGAAGASAGFTLVELMVTVFIAAILMAIGVPMMRESVATSRLTGQTNDMISAITLARSQAITLNQPVTFCRTTSNESVATPVCAASAGNWQYWIIRANTSGAIIRRGTLLASSVVVTSALTNDQVVFTSDGLARTNGSLVTGGPHITVCASTITTNNRRQVTIGAGSRISTARTSGTCP